MEKTPYPLQIHVTQPLAQHSTGETQEPHNTDKISAKNGGVGRGNANISKGPELMHRMLMLQRNPEPTQNWTYMQQITNPKGIWDPSMQPMTNTTANQMLTPLNRINSLHLLH